MRRSWSALAVATFLAACGGDAFVGSLDPTDPGDETDPTVPTEIQDDLEGITYNSRTQTLIVRGLTLDDEPFEAVYRRRAALDRAGYEAYTAQDASLEPHVTAYVKEVSGTRAAIVSSGGQFLYYFKGAIFDRDGAFDPPPLVDTSGQIEYAGRYVGLLNINGDGGDLFPVSAGTPIDLRPGQAAEVTGTVFSTVDFVDGAVTGLIYDREITDSPNTEVKDLEMKPTTIDANGRFTGELTIEKGVVGSYAGIFGGADSQVMAGATLMNGHVEGIDDIIESGIFVIEKCTAGNADPVCQQPFP